MTEPAVAATPGQAAASSSPRLGRNVGVLVGGQAGAQFLALAVSPLLGRLYDPHDFGALAVFAGLVAIFSVVASLRYHLAITLPEDDADADNIAALSLLCIVTTSALTALVVLCWGDWLVTTLNTGFDTVYLWLLPLGTFSAGLFDLVDRWLIRKHEFGQVARTRVIQSISGIVVQVAGYPFGVMALMLSVIAGKSVGGLRIVIHEFRTRRRGTVSWAGIGRMAERYRNFPLYSSWTGMANIAGVHLAPLLLAALFGASVVGYYAFASRLMQAPVMLIGSALANVFIAHAPAAMRSGNLFGPVEKLRRMIAIIGIPALALLVASGPDLFAFVFGEKWRQAGEYARWMAPWTYFQLQYFSLSGLAEVLELQKLELIAQGISFSLRLAAVGLCYWLAEPAHLSVVMFCVVSALGYFCMLAVLMSRVKVSVLAILSHDMRQLALFTALAFPAWWLCRWSFDLASMAAIAYFALLCGLWMRRALGTVRAIIAHEGMPT